MAALKRFKAEAEDAAKKAEKERQSLLDRLAPLENKPEQNASAQTKEPPLVSIASLSDDVHYQCYLIVAYSDDELPELKTVTDEESKRDIALLQRKLTARAQAGMIPITYGQLLSGTGEQRVTQAFRGIEDIIGDPIWARSYGPDNTPPKTTSHSRWALY